MGQVRASVRILGPEGSEELDLLVDTGATYTWVSKEALERLGIRPKGSKTFRLMDNNLVEKAFGEAVIDWNGEQVWTIVIFADRTDAEVFGLYSLEGLALEVDPVGRELRKSRFQLALAA